MAHTEAGLRELGLDELADCFKEAKEFMAPLLSHRTEADGNPYEILERIGLKERGEEIDDRAWQLRDIRPNESAMRLGSSTHTLIQNVSSGQ